VASAIGPGFPSHNALKESAHGLCRVKRQTLVGAHAGPRSSSGDASARAVRCDLSLALDGTSAERSGGRMPSSGVIS
jgi:hypothetical protein